ncbi:unnamed protein product, partial [Closterium sp. NIES-54]
ELAEARKKRRRPLFDLEKELTLLWEKSRQRNIDMEKKRKLVTMMTAKMKGKMVEMARSHTVSRVLQMCVKHGRKEEREAVFLELRPHCRELTVHPYAHHLVNRMMDHASKEKKHDIVGQLRGHVVEMMRHPVASA